MRTLNKQALAVFLKLVDGLDNGHRSRKIGIDGGAFMPLCVEVIDHPLCRVFEGSRAYSLAHYFEQNGDMCRDPEMIFIKAQKGDEVAVFPIAFYMDIPPVWRECVILDDGVKLRPKEQADETIFANTWMKNIKQQQHEYFKG